MDLTFIPTQSTNILILRGNLTLMNFYFLFLEFLKILSTLHDCWENIFCKALRWYLCRSINISSNIVPQPPFSLLTAYRKVGRAQVLYPRLLNPFSMETDQLLENLHPLLRLCYTSHASIFLPLRTAEEHSAHINFIKIPAL